jgi:hypothetical protein
MAAIADDAIDIPEIYGRTIAVAICNRVDEHDL